MTTYAQRLATQKHEASKVEKGDRRFTVWLSLSDRLFVEELAEKHGSAAGAIRAAVRALRKEVEG